MQAGVSLLIIVSAVLCILHWTVRQFLGDLDVHINSSLRMMDFQCQQHRTHLDYKFDTSCDARGMGWRTDRSRRINKIWSPLFWAILIVQSWMTALFFMFRRTLLGGTMSNLSLVRWGYHLFLCSPRLGGKISYYKLYIFKTFGSTRN